MWVIQNEMLLSIPDDAPLPPHSVKVDLPKDFQSNPSAYRIEGKNIVRSEAAEDSPGAAALRLSPEDVAKIKKAIERGDL